HRTLLSFPTRRSSDLAEEACFLPVRKVPAGPSHLLGKHDVRRQVAVAAFQKAERAADVRAFDPAGEQSAGLHHLVPGVVDRGGRSEEHTSELQSRENL